MGACASRDGQVLGARASAKSSPGGAPGNPGTQQASDELPEEVKAATARAISPADQSSETNEGNGATGGPDHTTCSSPDAPPGSQCFWFDEEEGDENVDSDGRNPAHGTEGTIATSKRTDGGNLNNLQQKRRRRLSVSTVEAGDASANREAEEARAARRTKITKFQDPAMELVDRTRGSVREVTLGMLKSLFPAAEHYCIFGSPSYDIQRGFDNKAAETGGSFPPGKTLKDIGVAYACKKGLKPESPNQDDFFVLRVDDWAMYGVFDGHGPCGHDISAFVHKTLPFLIISDPTFETDLPATLKRAFWRVHHLIEAAAEQAGSVLNCSLSGTTATVAVQRDNKLTMAYVGDSRAVIARKDTSDGRYLAKALTTDHKPTNPGERDRIENAGGEVRRLEGDIPHRVFVKNRMYPGLAMSRAIGDAVAAAVGVTPDPDIEIYDLGSNEKFFVIATDGVWEFIEDQQAVDIISQRKAAQVGEAAEALAYESWRRWVEEEENVVDDVTCIVVWLDHAKKHGNASSAASKRTAQANDEHERRRRKRDKPANPA